MSTQQRKAQEKEYRRQLILEAAEDLMRESGTHVLNIDAVAARTQLAKGTIYLNFSSKEEILAALTLKSRRLLFDELSAMAMSKPDPLSAIKGIILANYAFLKKNPLHYDLVSRYEANPTLTETDELQQATQNIRDLVIGLIDQAKATGQIRPDLDTITFSMYMWGTVTGLIQLIRGRKDLIETDDQLEDQKIIDLFNGILGNGVAL
ncbi:TetR/AcrR family transcriptional regulator [Spirosoma arcticum]